MTDLQPTQPLPAPTTPKQSSRASSLVLIAATLVAVAGVAFAAGRLTTLAGTATTSNGFPDGFPLASFTPGGGLVMRGLGGVTLRGEVTAISSDSITIKLDDGLSVSVALDEGTTYHQSTSGSAGDVSVGSKVAVEPDQIDVQPGASFAPGPGAGNVDFGPATDVTVVED